MTKHLKQSNGRFVGNILIGLAALIVLLVLALKFMVTTSYPVKESARTTDTTKVATHLYGIRSRTMPANTNLIVNHYYLLGQFHQLIVARVTFSDKQYFMPAKQLSLLQSNPINAYLARRDYPHCPIKPAIDRQFAKQPYQTFLNRPHGVVVHDTGTEHTTVASEVRYMENNYPNTGVFVHTFISASQIRNIANIHYMAQGAGPKANPYFVQFEMPHQYTSKTFARQLGNAAYYTATILRKNHLPVIKGTRQGDGTVWTHAMVSDYLGGTDHRDPNAYWANSADDLFDTDYGINDFINLVQAYYNRM